MLRSSLAQAGQSSLVNNNGQVNASWGQGHASRSLIQALGTKSPFF